MKTKLSDELIDAAEKFMLDVINASEQTDYATMYDMPQDILVPVLCALAIHWMQLIEKDVKEQAA